MGFGGATSAMITSLKNNKRKRSSAFDNLERDNLKYNTKLHFSKKATPKQLKNIRAKMQQENKIQLIIKTVIFIIFFLSILYFIF